jgi:hypothetical protein
MPLAEAGTSENGYIGDGLRKATSDATRDNAGEASVPAKDLRKSLLPIPTNAGLKRIVTFAPAAAHSERIAVLEQSPLFS